MHHTNALCREEDGVVFLVFLRNLLCQDAAKGAQYVRNVLFSFRVISKKEQQRLRDHKARY